jgi:pimeloyl-ACP methyl ester carboxylesterase
MPVLLMIGRRDRTAIGKERASDAQKKLLGNYPELGRKTASLIPDAKLVELPGVGHVPQVQAFPQFIEPVKDFLKAHPAR